MDRPCAKSQPPVPPIFIVGMSRAATTWLAKGLSQHPDICTFGETAFWGKRFITPANRDTFSSGEIEKMLLSLRNVSVRSHANSAPDSSRLSLPEVISVDRQTLVDTPADPGELYRSLLGCVARQTKTSVVIEKTPHHINWVSRILSFLPDARFIVHVREPYGFMRSYKHQGDRKPDKVKRAFDRRYHPIACAIIWRRYMRSATELISQHPDKTFLVRFEDVQSHGQKVLGDVQDFIGVRRLDLNSPPENSSFPQGAAGDLDAGDLFAMNLCARHELIRAGFAEQSSPGRVATKAAVLATFPKWAVRNYFNLGRHIKGSRLRYLLRWLS